MSAPRFLITISVHGTPLKFTMRTTAVLGEDPEATAKSLKEEIGFRFCSEQSNAFLGNLERFDLKAVRAQWGRHYRKLVLGMGESE